MNKLEERYNRKANNINSTPTMFSFEQQTANELNKYLNLKNKDHYNNSRNQQYSQNPQNHILRYSNFNNMNNNKSDRNKRHSTNFENYNSLNFNSFNSDAITASKHMNNEGSNSSSTTTPSSLGSDGNTKPSSKEKILSYSYYTNLNYDKQKHSRDATPLNFSIQSANDSMNDNEHETSLSHLDVSHPASQMKRGGEKKITNSKLNLSDLSTQQQESEIFQKIMNKLAELPESIRLKNFNTEALRSSINELKNKEALINMQNNSKNTPSNNGSSRNKYFQPPPNNYNHSKQSSLNSNTSNSHNNDTNLSKRSKYKSMFIENIETEQILNDKKLLNSLKNTKINLNSVAGDLMLSNNVPYKNDSKNNAANNDSIKNGMPSKAENIAYLQKSSHPNKNSYSSETNKKNDKSYHEEPSNQNDVNKLKSSSRPNKEAIKINENVEYILFDKIDELTNPLKANLKNNIVNSNEMGNNLYRNEKLNLKYQTLSINPRKNNHPDLTQNLKKFYSVNRAKVINNHTNHDNSLMKNSNLDVSSKLQTSDSNDKREQTKEKALTEEIEKEANFLISSNESDSSESTNKINETENKKNTKISAANPVATAKIINMYPNNQNIATVRLNQQQSIPFKHLDLKNPLIPVKNIKLSSKVIENDPLYARVLKEKSIESLKNKKYLKNLYNKSLLSSSSSSSNANNSSFKSNEINVLSNHSDFSNNGGKAEIKAPFMDKNSYLTNISVKTQNLNATDRSFDSNTFSNNPGYVSSNKESPVIPYTDKSTRNKNRQEQSIPNKMSNADKAAQALGHPNTKALLNNILSPKNSNLNEDTSKKKETNTEEDTLDLNNSTKNNNNNSVNNDDSDKNKPSSSQLEELPKSSHSNTEQTAKNRLKARDINLNLRELNFSDETLKKIEKVMEQHHLKQLNLYVNTDENETTSKDNTVDNLNISTNTNNSSSNNAVVSNSANLKNPNILQRKIATPPPLPQILDSKTKKIVSNVFNQPSTEEISPSNNLPTTEQQTRSTSKTKPNTITSSIRDGKVEKPIRVNHGLPPPPPAILNRQTPTISSFQSKINTNDKDLFMRKLATPLVGVNSPMVKPYSNNITSIPPRYVNPNVLAMKEASETNKNAEKNDRYEFYLEKKGKNTSDETTLKESLVDNNNQPKEKEKNNKKSSDNTNTNNVETSKEDSNKNKPNKSRFDPKNDKDLFSWNCAQLDNFIKAKNENKNGFQEAEIKNQNRINPINNVNIRVKPSTPSFGLSSNNEESPKNYLNNNNNNNNVPHHNHNQINIDDQLKLAELDNISDDGSGVEANFYESYSKENDKRKKEGNGFLMLLPGIAIPIDTDAGESDEDNTYNSN